uniref:uncharacterized protein n=1 Tax=Myxine glutinosa TaxID=7769 RepID=UPI00358E3882
MTRRFDASQNGRWQCVGHSALARAQIQLAGHRVSVNDVGTALQAHEIPEERLCDDKSARQHDHDDELLEFLRTMEAQTKSIRDERHSNISTPSATLSSQTDLSPVRNRFLKKRLPQNDNLLARAESMLVIDQSPRMPKASPSISDLSDLSMHSLSPPSTLSRSTHVPQPPFTAPPTKRSPRVLSTSALSQTRNSLSPRPASARQLSDQRETLSPTSEAHDELPSELSINEDTGRGSEVERDFLKGLNIQLLSLDELSFISAQTTTPTPASNLNRPPENPAFLDMPVTDGFHNDVDEESTSTAKEVQSTEEISEEIITEYSDDFEVSEQSDEELSVTKSSQESIQAHSVSEVIDQLVTMRNHDQSMFTQTTQGRMAEKLLLSSIRSKRRDCKNTTQSCPANSEFHRDVQSQGSTSTREPSRRREEEWRGVQHSSPRAVLYSRSTQTFQVQPSASLSDRPFVQDPIPVCGRISSMVDLEGPAAMLQEGLHAQLRLTAEFVERSRELRDLLITQLNTCSPLTPTSLANTKQFIRKHCHPRPTMDKAST